MQYILQVEVLNPLNGELSVTVSIVNSGSARPEDDAIVGLHLFRRQRLELTSRYKCILIIFWISISVKWKSIRFLLPLSLGLNCSHIPLLR